MTYIKINNIQYPATINGKMSDSTWDNRLVKSITLEMSYAEANSIFVNGVKWFIQQDNENAELVEYDNSEYSLAGDIIDHRDGTITVKMGKPTDLENALEMLLNTQEG